MPCISRNSLTKKAERYPFVLLQEQQSISIAKAGMVCRYIYIYTSVQFVKLSISISRYEYPDQRTYIEKLDFLFPFV